MECRVSEELCTSCFPIFILSNTNYVRLKLTQKVLHRDMPAAFKRDWRTDYLGCHCPESLTTHCVRTNIFRAQKRTDLAELIMPQIEQMHRHDVAMRKSRERESVGSADGKIHRIKLISVTVLGC